jgi:hypothetical protein
MISRTLVTLSPPQPVFLQIPPISYGTSGGIYKCVIAVTIRGPVLVTGSVEPPVRADGDEQIFNNARVKHVEFEEVWRQESRSIEQIDE